MPESIITSRRHPLVARCRDAADGHTGELLLEGPHLVADGIDAGLGLAVVIVSEGAETRPEIAAILNRARARGYLVQRVTPAVLDAASPTRTPVGLLALASLALQDVSRLIARPPALVTVAVGVQDPGNVGTLVRSSEAAGATGLVAAGTTAHPLGWKALRGAMGSSLRLPIARVADPIDALRSLQVAGLRLVALAADGTADLFETDLLGPLAICVGAEGPGLPAAARGMADVHLRIPMHAPVESLNVAVAASLVLFEIARQRAAVGKAGDVGVHDGRGGAPNRPTATQP
jgi:TrmH family RNA methyltransferase